MNINRNHIFVFLIAMLFLVSLIALREGYTGYQSLDEGDFECGDGVCTVPFEDEITCPRDCSSRPRNALPIVGLAVLLMIIGVFYFNFYRGGGDLRRLTKGKNPFKNNGDYNKVKDYIEDSLKLNFTKKKITKALYKKGWNKKQITFAYENVAWKQRRVLIDTAPKVTDRIKPAVDYIKKGFRVNLKEKEIKQALLKGGWKKKDINKAFKVAKD